MRARTGAGLIAHVSAHVPLADPPGDVRIMRLGSSASLTASECSSSMGKVLSGVGDSTDAWHHSQVQLPEGRRPGLTT